MHTGNIYQAGNYCKEGLFILWWTESKSSHTVMIDGSRACSQLCKLGTHTVLSSSGMASIAPRANANYEITHLWSCSLLPLSKAFFLCKSRVHFSRASSTCLLFHCQPGWRKTLHGLSLSLSFFPFALMLIQKGTKGERVHWTTGTTSPALLLR